MSVASDNTVQFINNNATEIVLVRRPRVATAAGGWTLGAPVNQAPQIGRLVERTGNHREIRTLPDGQIVVIERTLVLPAGANVERRDTFVAEGKTWQVETVSRVPTWRTACGVFRNG